MNTDSKNLVAISISTKDPIEVRQTANSWLGITVLLAVFAVIPLVVRRRARAKRFAPNLVRSAWLEIVANCGMNDEQRKVVESLSQRAGLDPCVIALCPSQFERAALMSAGQSDFRVVLQAVAKLHPDLNPEIKPDPRRRSPGKLNLTA